MNRRVIAAIWISLFATTTASARQIRFGNARTTPSGILHTTRVAFGDFNHDGNPDLAISSSYNQIAVFLGKWGGAFTGPAIYNLSFYVTGSVVVGDFNKDGKLDLAVVGGDSSGNGLAFLSGNGDGSFNPPKYFKTTLVGASITAVAADFNHDGNLDLFTGGNGSSEVILGDGKGNFQDADFENGVFGFGVAIADFNHDGNLDAATTQAFPYYNPTGVSVLLGKRDGTFESRQSYSGMEEPDAIATGDFNGDKILDLAVSDYLFNTVAIWQGSGDGTFSNVGQWYAGVNPDGIVVSDFNMDGKADLALSDYAGNITVLPGRGDGTFPNRTYLSSGNGPSYIVGGDFNHDGSPDLVIVNNLDNTFSVRLNALGTYVRLASPLNPSVLGQSATFTVTVRGSVTASKIPSGAITFRDGAKILGRTTLIAGTASLKTSSLSQGNHSITASYSGDANYNPHTSSALLQRIK